MAQSRTFPGKVRRDLARDALTQLDALITEGMNSGSAVPVTPEWWKQRHAALARHRRAQPNPNRRLDDAGRQAYLDAKGGIGLSPASEAADEFLDALHQATKRPHGARRRSRK